jgi:putative tryptophan/tyrosine transport system substrate-binding protein
MSIRRRDFIICAAGAVAWPRPIQAQRPDLIRHVGVLMSLDETDSEAPSRLAALRQGLQELGWSDGRNIRIDFRWMGGDWNLARTLAKELVELQPDLILGVSGASVAALVQNTRTIPIVFVAVGEPVESGLVTSWAEPGGNVTGVSNFWSSIGSKWLELLKKIAPRVGRVAFIVNPDTLPLARYFNSIETTAPQFGIEPVYRLVRDSPEIEDALAELGRQPNGGLIAAPDAFVVRHREQIIELALRYRLPAVYPYRYFAHDGGLLSYGVDPVDEYRQAAIYVDRILRGARPADLAIQHPAKFELVINVKTAKALGLTVPRALLILADEVIE